ncbi:MAG: GNAT family N-acetyltransferase [Vicinamibacteraceae bacterium]
MHIRRGTAEDAAALAAFAARTFAETFATDCTPEDMQAHLAQSYGVDRQGAELTDPHVVTLLAEQDGRLVGYAQLRNAPPPVSVVAPDVHELHRFYVDRPSQGAGVAQRLMAAVQDAAREAGARHLWLGVWEHNARALRFYAKCGFVDVGSHVFVLGGDRQTDRVMLAPVPNQ